MVTQLTSTNNATITAKSPMHGKRDDLDKAPELVSGSILEIGVVSGQSDCTIVEPQTKNQNLQAALRHRKASALFEPVLPPFKLDVDSGLLEIVEVSEYGSPRRPRALDHLLDGCPLFQNRGEQLVSPPHRLVSLHFLDECRGGTLLFLVVGERPSGEGELQPAENRLCLQIAAVLHEYASPKTVHRSHHRRERQAAS